MKRAIFGGSFDPLTKAHFDLGVNLSEIFDEVIVVPAYISPFKIGEMDLSGEERVELIRKAFAPYKNIVVSDYEISQADTSYSYKTAEHFSGEGIDLYFVIGSDGLSSLDKWARTDILKEKVTFFVVPRPYFPIKQADLDKAKGLFKVELAPFLGKEGSSSLLRVAVAFDKAEEIVPPEVSEYIKKRELYRDYCSITDSYERLKIKPSRAEHIYRTTKCAIILAKLNGANTQKTVRAALLHDIAKYLDRAELEKMGVEWDDEVEGLPPSCRHQLTGARLAKAYFNEADTDILSAIATHTTGARDMNIYQKIVFAADYIEEGRDFDGIERIRATVYENLDKGIIEIFENTIKYLTAVGQDIASQTIEAYEYYKERN